MSVGTKPKLCLFGQLRVVGEDKVIDSFATRRSALMLGRLGVARDHSMSRSDLADILWPEDYFDATRLRLRQELTRLRRSLDSMAHILVADADRPGDCPGRDDCYGRSEPSLLMPKSCLAANTNPLRM